MGGRGASAGTVKSKSTSDGKFMVGNTYRIKNDNVGVDYDYIVTDATKDMVVGRITNFRQGFIGQSKGSSINFKVNSMAYNQAKLLKRRK